MRKLLASVLGVPVAALLDLPDDPACQCCGTPFDVPNMPYGTNADGTENTDYCAWCYRDGEFTSQGLDEIVERNAPYLMEATGYSAEEAVSFLGTVLPTLKRWSGVENANLRRSSFYVCPSCGNVAWSAGEPPFASRCLPGTRSCQPTFPFKDSMSCFATAMSCSSR